MTYQEYISRVRLVKRIAEHMRAERGTGNCQDAIARNRTIKTLIDAEFSIMSEYAKQFSQQLDTHADIVSKIIDAKLTREFMTALGWQGGTVHQVAHEIINRGLQDQDIYAALRVISAHYWRVAKV